MGESGMVRGCEGTAVSCPAVQRTTSTSPECPTAAGGVGSPALPPFGDLELLVLIRRTRSNAEV